MSIKVSSRHINFASCMLTSKIQTEITEDSGQLGFVRERGLCLPIELRGYVFLLFTCTLLWQGEMTK